MKHLICLTTSYPQEANLLAGSFVLSLNQVYARAGWMPKVITFNRGDKRRTSQQPTRQFGSLNEEITLSPTWANSVTDGAPDHISAHPLLSLCTMPLNAWGLRRAYHQVIKSHQELHDVPSVAHWAIPSGWIARHQRPIVYCHGGDIALLERLPLGAVIARSLVKSAKGLVCVSDDLQSRLLKLIATQESVHRHKIYSLPMGIDDPEPSRAHLDRYRALSQDKVVLATVGRFSEIKGYHLLVESLGALSFQERDRLLWIAGGVGPELSKIKHRAKTLGVNMMSEGVISPPQRDALYQVCDLFIAPSCRVDYRVEGMPLALREAALSGCQVMTTSLGGGHEVVSHLPDSSVITVDPEIRSLKEALQAWLKTHKTSPDDLERCTNLKREVSSTARALWAWSHLGPKHLEIFEYLISRPY